MVAIYVREREDVYEGQQVAQHVAAVVVVRRQQTQQLQHLHLQEGVRDASHVVLALEAAADDHLHLLDQAGNQLAELGNHRRVLVQDEGRQRHRCREGKQSRLPLIRTP